MSFAAQIFVIVVTMLSLIGYIVLLWSSSKMKAGVKLGEEMQHEWDGIKELNSPLPKWWFWTFLGCTIWGIGFVLYYPALGNYKGLGDWTEVKQYEEEVQSTDKKYDEYYATITKGSIEQMAQTPAAVKTGRRLFLNNCAVCHGSDAYGSQGFPNLTDNDWLYGGDSATISQSITNGRGGVMPAQEQTILAIAKSNGLNTDTAVDDTIDYVLSLSGNGSANEAGKTIFSMVCAACHTPAGTGMQALGAPNLTDDIWLYDSGEQSAESLHDTVMTSIMQGRNGVMPAHKDILSEEKIKAIAAYVYSISNQ